MLPVVPPSTTNIADCPPWESALYRRSSHSFRPLCPADQCEDFPSGSTVLCIVWYLAGEGKWAVLVGKDSVVLIGLMEQSGRGATNYDRIPMFRLVSWRGRERMEGARTMPTRVWWEDGHTGRDSPLSQVSTEDCSPARG